MAPYDLATRAQVLSLTQLGLSHDDIEARIGVLSDSVHEIISHAISHGFDPNQMKLVNTRHVCNSVTLDRLPVELHLTIVSFLHLTSLIRMRTVSKYWRDLIKRNQRAPRVLHPARLALLELYDEVITKPAFQASREYLLPHLRTFVGCQHNRDHREMYLASLCMGRLPDQFELWVLEWPSAAVIGWTWPGLPRKPPLDTENGPKPSPWLMELSQANNMLSIREADRSEIDHVVFDLDKNNSIIELISGDERYNVKAKEWQNISKSQIRNNLETGTIWFSVPAIQISNGGIIYDDDDDDEDFQWELDPIMLVTDAGGPFTGQLIRADDGGSAHLMRNGKWNYALWEDWVDFLRYRAERMEDRYQGHLKTKEREEREKERNAKVKEVAKSRPLRRSTRIAAKVPDEASG